MLILQNKLINMPVVSIQAEHRVGVVVDYLINPRKLHIAALFVQTKFELEPLILHTSDIKNFNLNAIVIDHNDRLMSPNGLVRLKKIMDINFQLVDKNVITESKHRLGKVSSFAFDTDSFMIMRLHVRQSIVKSLSSAELAIHRQQIVTVTDSEVIVRDATIKEKAGSSLGLKKLFFNTRRPARATPEPSPAKLDNIS